MKKLLVLVLVLGLASLASAMTLSISVGGDTGVTAITVSPSTNLVLDVHSNGFLPGEATFWGLIAIGPGTISGGAVILPPAPDASSMLYDPELASMFGGPGVFGYIDAWSGTATAQAGTYFDGINFHCDGPGQVLVQLVTTADFATYTLVDTVVVTQIPEPATLVLLSLGGLLLRKKK